MTQFAAISSSQTLGATIHDLARLFRKRFEQVSRRRRLGLTRAQAAVIVHLARHEGTNQVSLAQIMELEPITLVRLLDRLQAAGLIERRADPTDRRARRLYLSPAAHPQLTQIKLVMEEVQAEAFAGVVPSQRDLLLQTMLTAKANLLERTADPAEAVDEFEPEWAANG